MQNSAHPPSSPTAPPGGYEPTDVNIGGIMIFLGILTGIVVLVHLVTTAMEHQFAHQAVQRDKQLLRSQVVPSVAASRAYFPQPREQVSPRTDLRTFRAQEETELNSYGWIDRKAGVVRIPIERALELISRQGLPTRTDAKSDKTGPSTLQLQQERPLQYTPPGQEEKQ